MEFGAQRQHAAWHRFWQRVIEAKEGTRFLRGWPRSRRYYVALYHAREHDSASLSTLAFPFLFCSVPFLSSEGSAAPNTGRAKIRSRLHRYPYSRTRAG